jgi:hypothetical protein
MEKERVSFVGEPISAAELREIITEFQQRKDTEDPDSIIADLAVRNVSKVQHDEPRPGDTEHQR